MARKPPTCQVSIRMSDGRLLASGIAHGVMEWSDEASAEERQVICDRMAASFIEGPGLAYARAQAVRQAAAGD